MAELMDIFKGFPVINFDSKKTFLLQELSKKFPHNKKIIELVSMLRKSSTIINPADYPLSNDFLTDISAAVNESEVEKMLSDRLDEQQMELQKDYNYRMEQIANQYHSFVHNWDSYQKSIADYSKQLGRKVNTNKINGLISQLQAEILNIKNAE